MPTTTKATATRIVRVSLTARRRSAMSTMLSVPVIWYMRPMPISRKVAPIVPMIR